MKLNKTVLANASAVWMGVIYLACGFAVSAFPGLSKTLTQSWFHGIDVAKLWSGEPFPGNFLLGLVSSVILTWVAAYLFAYLYNYFLGKK
jgi:hypothetical protein